MKQVMIVGAGRLGKGFFGETFDNTGWNIVFLDKDPKVIDELKKTGSYHVEVHRVDSIEERTVSGYEAYVCDKEYSCMDAFLNTDVIMLPLYPKDFKEAGHYLSKCFIEFYNKQPEKKLTAICVTNKNYLIPGIVESFKEKLPDDVKAWFDTNVAVRDSIIRRGTDASSHYSTEIVTMAVASLLIQTPVYNDFSDVEWLELNDRIELLKDLKVFAINGPHASTAFWGYLKGYKTIPESEKDEEIAGIIDQVHQEILDMIGQEYDITKEELDNLENLPTPMGEIPDSIYRVAFDPIRKLSKGDRLAGAAELCRKHGMSYEAIAKGMAAGFAYSEPKDENAVILQEDIKELGIGEAVHKYTELDKDSPILQKVVEEYEALKARGLVK
ncbi:mannitol dehydrogenase [Anaerostipes sp.]|uniref:mannitol dehydrogenase family protein n=1 Tax=Anaerostipes sp. TaxID=1872530 RepID=UPI0025C3BA9F|nr:mannitol dehydrogenase [Anaerostipes sp.]MBS7008600.1 mannitol dehydrogenase [Anaerostipes sp.]